MRPTGFREVFSEGGRILDELPLIGWARISHARVPGLTAHRHEGAWEIFYVERGRVEWWVEEEVHALSAGNVYINRPGELHGSVGVGLKPCGYYWLNLVVPQNGFSGMTRKESETLQKRVEGMKRRTFPGSTELKACFRDLLSCHREHATALEVRARLHLLLIRLLCDHEKAGASQIASAGPSFAIARALSMMQKDLAGVESIEALARSVGLGTTRFADRFLREVGFPPAAYLRRQRVELAKVYLRRGSKSLCDIAQEVGFSSSQHFATAFKQIEGVPPSQYRQTGAAGSTEASYKTKHPAA